MAAHHHIFVGILAATDDAEDVVIFHRAGEEVVADVELQLEILTVHHLLLYDLELVFVEQDVFIAILLEQFTGVDKQHVGIHLGTLFQHDDTGGDTHAKK